jgi:hypothetical protein
MGAGARRRRLRRKKPIAITREIIETPPTLPPAMAPVFELLFGVPLPSIAPGACSGVSRKTGRGSLGVRH